MNITTTTLAAFVIGGSVWAAGAFAAAPSTALAFEQCRAEAEVAYGNPDEPARVRLDGTRKSGTQLSLRVFTPAGEVLRAFCTIDKETGELVALDPPAAPGKEQRLTLRP